MAVVGTIWMRLAFVSQQLDRLHHPSWRSDHHDQLDGGRRDGRWQ